MTDQEILEQKFGRLTPTEYVAGSRSVKPKFKCLCNCGNICLVSKQNLSSGKTKSCGCLSSEMLSERNTKHDMIDAPEYSVWCGIKARCKNKNTPSYRNYGGRGIAICESWDADFKAFLSDMGERPTENHSIERINTNGNYEPSNCKWADKYEQARNKRTSRRNKSGVKGVCFCPVQSQWVAYWNDNGSQKRRSFSTNKHGEDAFEMAVNARARAIKKLELKGVFYVQY